VQVGGQLHSASFGIRCGGFKFQFVESSTAMGNLLRSRIMIKDRGANRMIFIILLLALAFIAVILELLNAHPQFTVGHTQIYWSGLWHMSFGSHAESVSAFGVSLNDVGGNAFDLGPVRFSSVP
jgi:hypothetical protein